MCISIIFVCLDLNIVYKFSLRQLCSQTIESSPEVLLDKIVLESNGFKSACAERLSPFGRKPISGKVPLHFSLSFLLQDSLVSFLAGRADFAVALPILS